MQDQENQGRGITPKQIKADVKVENTEGLKCSEDQIKAMSINEGKASNIINKAKQIQQNLIQQLQLPEKRGIDVQAPNFEKTYTPIDQNGGNIQNQAQPQQPNIQERTKKEQEKQDKKKKPKEDRSAEKKKEPEVQQAQQACKSFDFRKYHDNKTEYKWEIARCQKNIKLLVHFNNEDLTAQLIMHFALKLRGLARFQFDHLEVYLIQVNDNKDSLKQKILKNCKLFYFVNDEITDKLWTSGKLMECTYPDRYNNHQLMKNYMLNVMIGSTFSIEYKEDYKEERGKTIQQLKLEVGFIHQIGIKQGRWILFLNFDSPIHTISSMIFNPSYEDQPLIIGYSLYNTQAIYDYLKNQGYMNLTNSIENQQNKIKLEDLIVSDPRNIYMLKVSSFVLG